MNINCEREYENKNHEIKSVIRKHAIHARRALTEFEVISKSSEIIEKLVSIPKVAVCKNIMCYVSFNNEVKTLEFIKMCMCMGKNVSIPFISNKIFTDSHNGQEMSKEIINSSLVKDCEIDLREGKYNILEPKLNCIRLIDICYLDIIIVPGVAFDVKGNRLGYGKGYYDEFLENIPKRCLKIGLAFEIQLFSSLPCFRYDVPMDLIITEKDIYNFGRE